VILSGLKLVGNVGKNAFCHFRIINQVRVDSTANMKRERRAGIEVSLGAGFRACLFPTGAGSGQQGIIPKTEIRDCPSQDGPSLSSPSLLLLQ